ncbi:MAG: 2-oxoacid:acceptor oxidoreductase subunit alpha [Chloroflexi bacterium]|nr:2-oxoacid:acceptor oxidoreductase subunit alpha [Chloroflexota bacterium]
MPHIRSMSGNAVIAEAAIAAGCRFFAGYPITPSSEIAAVLAEELPKVGGVFLQMEDEIAAMGAIIGASLGGMKTMTATSGPGFSLKQENLGFACMAEVPCVVVNVMRGGPSTGLPTLPAQGDVMQARWGTHGDHPIIVLYPADLTEMYHQTVRAFNLAEQYRTPVILLSDELLGHMSERVEIPDAADLTIVNRRKPDVPPEQYLPYDVRRELVPPMANFFEGYRYHVTGLTHDETGFPTEDPDLAEAQLRRLMLKVSANADDILEWEEDGLADAEIAIFAYGAAARSVREAIAELRSLGVRAGLFRPITLWPFPDKALHLAVSRAGALFVVEMNMGQMIREVERSIRHIPIIGVHKVSGQPIDPDEIVFTVRDYLENGTLPRNAVYQMSV